MTRRHFVCSVAVALFGLACATPPAVAAVITVNDTAGLRAAVAAAEPGDEIVLAAGTYDLGSSVTVTRAGTAAAPIRVRAQTPRTALIRVATLVGFRISAPDWRFEGLDIAGNCASDDDCEHAFQVVANGDRTVLRDNHLRDFNAPVKGNGAPIGPGGSFVFANDVLIEGNRLYATRARNTANPVTFIDVVGGRGWVIRDNVIHDFQKAFGDGISYGAFLKGNSRDGLFERNLVICSRALTGGTRIGLSLGGGGTAAQFCEDADCTTEHQDGTLRNNLILNCSDVGIYLNRAAGSRIDHNTLFATAGIDVRFPTSTAVIRNNASTGAIRNRDGGTSSQAGNLLSVPMATMRGWFVDPDDADFRALDTLSLRDQGVSGTGVDDDYCADDRDDGLADIGALEYDGERDCDTRVDAPPDAVFGNSFE